MRRAHADAGQPLELGDEIVDRRRKHAMIVPAGFGLTSRKAQALEASHGGAELGLDQALRRAERLVDRRGHHVLKQLRVVRIDRLGRNLDLDDLERAGRLDRHHPAARGGFDRLVLQFLLGLGHLGLHLLRLLHQLVQIHCHGSSFRRWRRSAFLGRPLGVDAGADSIPIRTRRAACRQRAAGVGGAGFARREPAPAGARYSSISWASKVCLTSSTMSSSPAGSSSSTSSRSPRAKATASWRPVTS